MFMVAQEVDGGMEAYLVIIEDELSKAEFERWARAMRVASELSEVSLAALMEVEVNES